MSQYHRRSIRLPGYDYTQPGGYFVTLVAHDGVQIFGEVIDGQMKPNAFGKVVLDQWDRLPVKFPGLTISERIVMPNHFHGIIVLSESDKSARGEFVSGNLEKLPLRSGQPNPRVIPGSIGAIVRAYKSAVTYRIRTINNDRIVIWQRNYYEHIIRNQGEFQTIVDYILYNPIRWAEDRFFMT